MAIACKTGKPWADPERLDLDVVAKMAVLAVIMFAVNLAWLFAGVALTQLFRIPRTNRAINVTFAILLIASLAFALLF